MGAGVLALGVAGMLLIAAGWASSVSSRPPLRLSALYFAGSLLLTIYAVMIRDAVFTVLNAAAAGLAAANMAATLRSRRGAGKT